MPDQVGTSQVIRFATFEVDLQAQELRKGGLRLKLTGQPFQVLTILLERPGTVVTRDEFQKQLWPDTFVDVDHNLNTAINKIREALGDSSENPRFIETLPRRGYRFIAPITVNGTAAATAQAVKNGAIGAPESAAAIRALGPLAVLGAVMLLGVGFWVSTSGAKLLQHRSNAPSLASLSTKVCRMSQRGRRTGGTLHTARIEAGSSTSGYSRSASAIRCRSRKGPGTIGSRTGRRMANTSPIAPRIGKAVCISRRPLVVQDWSERFRTSDIFLVGRRMGLKFYLGII